MAVVAVLEVVHCEPCCSLLLCHQETSLIFLPLCPGPCPAFLKRQGEWPQGKAPCKEWVLPLHIRLQLCELFLPEAIFPSARVWKEQVSLLCAYVSALIRVASVSSATGTSGDPQVPGPIELCPVEGRH